MFKDELILNKQPRNGAVLLLAAVSLFFLEYIILKRKIDEDAEFPAPRISRHVPAHGKPSVNKAWGGFMEFVNTVFDGEGNYRTDIEYPIKKGKPCDWCEFKERGLCPGWKKFI